MKRIVVFLSLIVVLAVACARHDDSLQPKLSVILSPTPGSFTVASSDFIVWNLSWTISDPTTVLFYRVYTLDPFTGAPELADTAMTTSGQYNTTTALPGLVWGVASVSTDHVESAIVFGTAP